MADMYQPADATELAIWEADKLRRIETLRQMGWDQAAIDKMFGIHRTEGLTISDRRPFSQTGRSSAPRLIGKPTPPGIESLKNPRRWNAYGQWDLEGKWAPKPPHGFVPPDGTTRTARQQILTSRVGPGGIDPRPTHPFAGQFGYGTTIDLNAIAPPRRGPMRLTGQIDPASGSMLAEGKGHVKPTLQGPESIYHQLKAMPGDEFGRKPSVEMVKMMTQWENMVKGPKKQLAGQLARFASKWGLAGIKFMAKMPK